MPSTVTAFIYRPDMLHISGRYARTHPYRPRHPRRPRSRPPERVRHQEAHRLLDPLLLGRELWADLPRAPAARGGRPRRGGCALRRAPSPRVRAHGCRPRRAARVACRRWIGHVRVSGRGPPQALLRRSPGTRRGSRAHSEDASTVRRDPDEFPRARRRPCERARGRPGAVPVLRAGLRDRVHRVDRRLVGTARGGAQALSSAGASSMTLRGRRWRRPPTKNTATRRPRNDRIVQNQKTSWKPTTKASCTNERIWVCTWAGKCESAAFAESVPARIPCAASLSRSLTFSPAPVVFESSLCSDAVANTVVASPSPTAPPAIWNMYVRPPARLWREALTAVTAAVVTDGKKTPTPAPMTTMPAMSSR